MASPFADPVTPLRRFSALWTTLPSPQGDAIAEFPLICLAGVPIPATPSEVAHTLVGHAHHLAHGHRGLSEPVRMQIAAALLHADRTVDEFTAALRPCRELFHREHVDADAGAVALATAVLLLRQDGPHFSHQDAERAAHLYQRIRRRHWWMGVPADLPTSAMLSSVRGEPATIETHIEQTYHALVQHGVAQGTSLHLAAALLAASPDGISHGYQRVLGVLQAFRVQAIEPHAFAAALLALLPHDPHHIVEQYRAIDAYVRTQVGLHDDVTARLVSSGLTYLDLAAFNADGTHRQDGGRRHLELTELLQCALCCWAAPKEAMATASKEPNE